jgi:hypothetical protein
MIIELEAREELRVAAAWYEDQREGLGDEFLAAIDAVVTLIQEAPMSFPVDRFDERARRACGNALPVCRRVRRA